MLFNFWKRPKAESSSSLLDCDPEAVFVCLQPDNQARADTVGVPCAGVEIKVADNGEVLVKSAGLLKAYYKNPEATAEVLTADGWYKTNDAGFIDNQGHLKIIDRVKDVGRIQGGSNDGAMFAPKYVENKLKFFPHIKEVVAYGDGRDKVCVMLNIDFEAVGNWAERRNCAKLMLKMRLQDAVFVRIPLQVGKPSVFFVIADMNSIVAALILGSRVMCIAQCVDGIFVKMMKKKVKSMNNM